MRLDPDTEKWLSDSAPRTLSLAEIVTQIETLPTGAITFGVVTSGGNAITQALARVWLGAFNPVIMRVRVLDATGEFYTQACEDGAHVRAAEWVRAHARAIMRGAGSADSRVIAVQAIRARVGVQADPGTLVPISHEFMTKWEGRDA